MDKSLRRKTYKAVYTSIGIEISSKTISLIDLHCVDWSMEIVTRRMWARECACHGFSVYVHLWSLYGRFRNERRCRFTEHELQNACQCRKVCQRNQLCTRMP